MICRFIFSCACLLATCCNLAHGQTVQLPSVQRLSISTTVSVPDRGQILLGGVKRANSSRKSNGVFRPGSSIGLDRSWSGISAGVYIHDFAAMDAYLLGKTGPNFPTQGMPIPSMYGPRLPAQSTGLRTSTSATQAQALVAARQADAIRQRLAEQKQTLAEIKQERRPRAALAWMKMADSAAEKGQTEKARRYYERAKSYGATAAVAKLKLLSNPKTVAAVGTTSGTKSKQTKAQAERQNSMLFHKHR